MGALLCVFSVAASESAHKKRRIIQDIDDAKAFLVRGVRFFGEQQYRAARVEFEQAAQDEYDNETCVLAFVNLAKLYQGGLGVKKNRSKVKQYLRDARKFAEGTDFLAELSLVEKLYAYYQDNADLGPLVEEFLLQDDLDHHICLLNFAIKRNYKELVWFLLKLYVDSKELDVAENPHFLNEAVMRGYKDISTLLLDHGAAINSLTEEGNTALHNAKTSDLVTLLVRKGAYLDAKGKRGYTPLFALIYAFRLDKEGRKLLFDAISALIDEGADMNQPDEKNWYPLHLAVLPGEGYYEEAAIEMLIDLLLSRNCNVNAVNDAGQTPLHIAASYGLGGVISKLLLKGADLTIADKGGKRARHLAVLAGHKKVADLLDNEGFLGYTLFLYRLLLPIELSINESRAYWLVRIADYVRRAFLRTAPSNLDNIFTAVDMVLLAKMVPWRNAKVAFVGGALVESVVSVYNCSGLDVGIDSWLGTLPISVEDLFSYLIGTAVELG